MKKLLIITACLALVLLCNIHPSTAQEKPTPTKYEYAIVKWDGPDQPARFKWVLRPDLDEPARDLAAITD